MILLHRAVDELSKSCFFLLQFFSSNGFPCPALRNPSDHYLRTINADFDTVNTSHDKPFLLRDDALYPSKTHYLFHQDVEQGHGGSTEEAISVLVKSYKSSEISQRVCLRAASIRDQVNIAVLNSCKAI